MPEIEFTPRSLHLHTLDSLMADLVSGRSVLVGEDLFKFDSKHTRSALEWYRQRGKNSWSANVSKPHGESLVDAILVDPPDIEILSTSADNQNHRRLKLKKMEAHRFAGIHRYGTPQSAPPNYIHEFDGALTLFEGRNGSGKTSLINAIIWALTGEILRTQRAPEVATDEFECLVLPKGDTEKASTHLTSLVSPLPDVNDYHPEGDKIPTDTWVILTFLDETGETISIRRSQTRTSRNKLVENIEIRQPSATNFTPVTSLSELGIDPIAFRIGTVMPGLLPTINLDQATELGTAVGELTGLASLVDLQNHARKAKGHINGSYSKVKNKEIEQADIAYNTAKSDLEDILKDHSNIVPIQDIPTPSSDETIEETLNEIETHFSENKSLAFESAESILGKSFDPEDAQALADLEDNIAIAIDSLRPPLELSSFTRLRNLGLLSENEQRAITGKINEIIAEGRKLQELASDPDLAARERLYARVAMWIADHPDPSRDLDLSAVCGSNHLELVDPITKRPVKRHIQEAQENAVLVSQLLEQWAKNAMGNLIRFLPDTIRNELSDQLPPHPCDLIKRALFVELFNKRPFKGVLSALKKEVEELFDGVISEKMELGDEMPIILPAGCEDLEQTLKKIDLAIRFAKWRQENEGLAKKVFESVIGNVDYPAKEQNTLSDKLLKLDEIVTSAEPISAAIKYCDRLKQGLNSRRIAEKQLFEYGIASAALNELMSLGDLAKKQVDELQKVLRDEAIKWRDAIYRGAYPTTAHQLSSTSSSVKGELGIMVEAEGVEAPAQHVSNASALRANLIAFYLAFWEHVLKERGGFTTVILDDPQELLDSENSERLAKAMKGLLASGANPILTSYDKRFAETVSRLANITDVAHFSVLPATALNPVVRTVLPLSEIKKRKNIYEGDVDAEEPARDFAGQCRIFLESKLSSLFDDPAYSVWVQANPKPTFDKLLGRLRSEVNANSNGMFKAEIFKRFCEHDSLSDQSPVINLMNKLHHKDRQDVTAADVASCTDNLNELLDIAEKMDVECYRWRRRDSVSSSSVDLPKPIPLAAFQVPELEVSLCPDLAAFTSYNPIEGTQDNEELLDLRVLQNKTAFYLRRENFGFAAPAGSIAIVESVSMPVADRRLVVARQGDKIYARRFLKSDAGMTIGLTSDNPDPRKRNPRTLFLQENEVELHQVCGIIFDHDIVCGHGNDEAVEIDPTKILEKIEIAYRVRDTSAVPLALDKQIVLGGHNIALDEIGQHEGRLVALSLNDGACMFKRVDDVISHSLEHLRQFESIGGLGSSDVLNIGMPQKGVRSILSARKIIGVLYNN